MIGQITSLPSSRYIPINATHTGTVQTADALKNICDILADRTNVPTSSQLNKQGYIVIKIACTVDVIVEKNGEVLKSDKNDIQTMSSYGVLVIFGENADVKTMCLDVDEYNIKLNANDEGTMDFTVRYS